MNGIYVEWQRDTSLPEAPSRYDVRIHCIEDCESSHTSTPQVTGTDAIDYSYPVTWTYNDRVLSITIFAFDSVGSIVQSYPTITFTVPHYIPPPPPPPTPGAPSLGTLGTQVNASWEAYPGASFYSIEVCVNQSCTPYTGESQLSYTNSKVLDLIAPEHNGIIVKVIAYDGSNYTLYAYPHATGYNPNYGVTPTPQPQVTTTTQPATAPDPTPEPEVLGVEDEAGDDLIEEAAEDVETDELAEVEDQDQNQTESEETSSPDSPIVDFIAGYWYILAGGLVVALGGVVGVYWWQQKHKT